MIFKNMWPTPIAFFEHPDADSINKEIMSHDEIRQCNFWQKKNLWEYNDKIPALAELHRWMLECSAEYAMQCFDFDYKPEYFEHKHAFINYRPRGEEVLVHTHRLTTIVMTYYVQVGDGTGDIRLLDPRSHLGWISLNAGKPYNYYDHHPKAGQMIMFPGWVTHAVRQNQTDEERVAVSSNVFLKDEYTFDMF